MEYLIKKFDKIFSGKCSGKLIILCLIFVIGIFGACSKQENTVDAGLTILYTNDIHCCYDNYPLIVAYKENLKHSGTNVITVDGGDFVQGNPAGATDKGSTMIRLMNAAEYDYAIPGNHDYDYGMDAFTDNAKNANFEWISCNYSGTGKYEEAFVHEPYKIIEVGKHRVALVGIEKESSIDASVEKVSKAIADAKSKEADFIIAVGHTGGATQKIIENTTGIDIYLNAHDHVVSDMKDSPLSYQNVDKKMIPVFETGTGFKYIGKLDLNCNSEEIRYGFELKQASDVESEIKDSTSQDVVKVRNECEAIVDSCDKIMEPYKKEVGTSECTLCVYDPINFPQYKDYIEYNSTDFIADAFRTVGKTDVALLNLDSVRIGLHPGKITKLDIYNLYPWNSKLYTTNLSGQQIIDILEFNLRNCPRYTPASPVVSGMTFTIDTSVPWTENGSKRVKSVMIGDKPIDAKKTYSVAISEYYLLVANKNIIKKTADDCTCIGSDIDAIETYIKDGLNGKIPESIYGNPAGSFRINRK